MWEASSGRVFLDSGLAAKMALAGLATAAGDGSHAREAAGDAVLQAPSAGGGTSEGSGGLPALLAAFVERLAGQAADATGLLQGGKVRRGSRVAGASGGRASRAARCLRARSSE